MTLEFNDILLYADANGKVKIDVIYELSYAPANFLPLLNYQYGHKNLHCKERDE